MFSPPANYKIEQDRFEGLTWPFVSPRIFFTFQFMRRTIEKENNRQRVYFWNTRVNHETLLPNKLALRLNRAFPRSLRSDYTSLSYLRNLQRTFLAFLSILSFEERRAGGRFIARNTPFKFMLKSILSRNGTIPKHDFSFIRLFKRVRNHRVSRYFLKIVYSSRCYLHISMKLTREKYRFCRFEFQILLINIV